MRVVKDHDRVGNVQALRLARGRVNNVVVRRKDDVGAPQGIAREVVRTRPGCATRPPPPQPIGACDPTATAGANRIRAPAVVRPRSSRQAPRSSPVLAPGLDELLDVANRLEEERLVPQHACGAGSQHQRQLAGPPDRTKRALQSPRRHGACPSSGVVAHLQCGSGTRTCALPRAAGTAGCGPCWSRPSRPRGGCRSAPGTPAGTPARCMSRMFARARGTCAARERVQPRANAAGHASSSARRAVVVRVRRPSKLADGLRELRVRSRREDDLGRREARVLELWHGGGGVDEVAGQLDRRASAEMHRLRPRLIRLSPRQRRAQQAQRLAGARR